MDAPLIMRVLASSVSLAGRASSIIRTVLASKSLEIIDKGVDDFQSKADRDAQRCIIGSLSHSFPGLTIIGEEGELDPKQSLTCDELDNNVLTKSCPSAFLSTQLSDMVVWVDPLDGTKEFTEGLLDYVTVLIGIAVKGRPVAGVVAQPFFQGNENNPRVENPPASETKARVIWALEGLGVFGITPRLPPSELPYPLDPAKKQGQVPNIAIITRTHANENLSATLDACAVTEVVRAGGCGYKVLGLLEGRAHVYPFPTTGTKRWDSCAPEALLTVAGGRMTDIHGRPYDYGASVDPMNLSGLMATPVSDWLPLFIQRIPQHVIDSLS